MATATTLKNHSGYPLFDEYTITELAERLRLTEVYLAGFKYSHKKRVSPRFRQVACAILQRPEEELFGPEDEVEEEAEADA